MPAPGDCSEEFRDTLRGYKARSLESLHRAALDRVAADGVHVDGAC